MNTMTPAHKNIEQALAGVFRAPTQSEACDLLAHDGRGHVRCVQAKVSGQVRHFLVHFLEHAPIHIGAASNEVRSLAKHFSDHVVLVAAPYLNSSMRSRLEDEGINYLDLAGHAFIEAPDLFVRYQAPKDRPPDLQARQSEGPSPFAKKASMILRVLCKNIGRAWGVREMARESQVSAGHASNVLREMERRGYVAKEDKGYVLQDAQRLLAHWVMAYSWEDNSIHSLQAPYSQEELEERLKKWFKEEHAQYALTLLAGSDRLAPHVVHNQLHVYVEESAVRSVVGFLRDAMQAESVARGGNVHILEPYYRQATFFGTSVRNGLPVVSPLQLFLDLAHYPVRGGEAAEAVLRDVLAPALRLSREESRWLTDFVAEL